MESRLSERRRRAAASAAAVGRRISAAVVVVVVAMQQMLLPLLMSLESEKAVRESIAGKVERSSEIAGIGHKRGRGGSTGQVKGEGDLDLDTFFFLRF